MTGTSSMVASALITTFFSPRSLPCSRKQIALARSRDEGSWCHPIVPAHRCDDLCLPNQGAPVGNGGLPAAANRSLSPRRLARAIRIALAVPVLTVPGSLAGPRDLLVPARTTLPAS